MGCNCKNKGGTANNTAPRGIVYSPTNTGARNVTRQPVAQPSGTGRSTIPKLPTGLRR